jgi:hypothetical protein
MSSKKPVTRKKNVQWAEVVTPIVRKSYVLSRFWAWFCRIELEPQVRIPLPRVFTVRDP